MRTLLLDEKQIINLYLSGLSIKNIGIKFNVSENTISKRLKKHNIYIKYTPDYKLNISKNYFSIINNEFKAYFLGFLYADGCMNSNNYGISIDLAGKDKILLDFFNKILFNGLKKLYERKGRWIQHSNGKNYYADTQYSFNFKNKKIYNDLIKLGCTPRKSLNLGFPNFNQVPEHLMNHFIRGYFDGDGTIVRRKRRKGLEHEVKIISSNLFCENLKIFLEKINIPSRIEKCNKVARVVITKKISILDFFNYMYKDATIFLERKKEKFDLKFLATMHKRF